METAMIPNLSTVQLLVMGVQSTILTAEQLKTPVFMNVFQEIMLEQSTVFLEM